MNVENEDSSEKLIETEFSLLLKGKDDLESGRVKIYTSNRDILGRNKIEIPPLGVQGANESANQ